MGIILYNGDSFTYGDELEGSRDPRGIDHDSHHEHTYAYKLSDKLVKEHVNLAHTGSSNSKIFRRTLDFLQNTDERIDLMVICWTAWSRLEVCNNVPYFPNSANPIETNMEQIVPWSKKCGLGLLSGVENIKTEELDTFTTKDSMERKSKILSLYLHEISTLQTGIIETLTYMKHIQWLCDKMNIPIVQGTIHDSLYGAMLSTLKGDGFKDYRKSVIDSLSFLREECKVGLGYLSDLNTIAREYSGFKPLGHPDEKTHTIFADMLFDMIMEKRLVRR